MVYLFGFRANAQSSPCYFLTDTGTIQVEVSNSEIELADGNVYVAGTQGNGPYGKDDIALLKINPCGKVLWIKYFGDTLANDGYYINKTHDQKLVLVGQTGLVNQGSAAIFYKLDTSGAILIKKTYGDTLSQMAHYVEETSDHGFVFCGYISDAFGSNNSYNVKIDSLGNLIWQLVFGGPALEEADQIHELWDGNFLITGDTKSYGHGGVDVEVTKCNRNGQVIWDNYYGDRLNNGCQGILEVSNGKYLSFGETEITGNIAFDFFIQFIDTNGVLLSRHTFGGTEADALFSLVEVPGFEFICTGYSMSYNGGTDDDIVLFKVDQNGQIKWLKNFFHPGVDIGYKILQSQSGGYLVTGMYDDNNDNYLLIHSDTIPNTSVGIGSVKAGAPLLSVFPEPVSDFLNVKVTTGHIRNVTLTDEMGRMLFSDPAILNKTHLEIDMQYYSSGFYFLQISTDNGKITRKVIKQ